eukprot:jgi/Chlat1/7727/Chrsp66S07319
MAATAGQAIYIPVQGSEEVVALPLDALPENIDDVLDIMRAERAPLDLWIAVAREYYRQGKVEQFTHILYEASSPEAEKHFGALGFQAERVAILLALASHLVELHKIVPAHKDTLSESQSYVFRAGQIDHDSSMLCVVRAQQCLVRNDITGATSAYNLAVTVDPKNAAAIIGQAVLAFNRKDYTRAANLFQNALRFMPTCPPALRLGFAMLYYKRGNLDKMREALERLDPDCVEALAAMAILSINVGSEEAIRMAMQILEHAYSVDPRNKQVLNHLARHYLYHNQYDRAQMLAQFAVSLPSANSQLRAESHYYHAQACHAQGDYVTALQHYKQAAALLQDKEGNTFLLPFYGLAQMHYQKGELKSAIACLTRVVERHPDNYETLKMLGSLHLQMQHRDQALTYLKRATALEPADVDAWIEIANLQEQIEPAEAVGSYQKALKLLKRRGDPWPPELLNNLGALKHVSGDLKGAMDTYQQALEAAGAMPASNGNHSSANGINGEEHADLRTPAAVTITFNIARLHEEQHDVQKAEALYRHILLEYPDYTDCHLRLATLAKERGDYNAAMQQLKTASAGNTNVDLQAALGNLYMLQGDWHAARQAFKSAVQFKVDKADRDNKSDAQADKKIEKHFLDAYSILSMANVDYYSSVETSNPEKKEKLLANALRMFEDVLESKHNNIYAANGIGIILAERGRIEAAKEVFTLVQEAAASELTGGMAHAYENLGHIFLAQGHYVNAIKMYENALKKSDSRDVSVLLYLARALYDSDMLMECKRILLKALHVSPDDQMVRFDLAVVMQEHAVRTLRKDKHTLAGMQQAIAELEGCLLIFQQLEKLGDMPEYGLSLKRTKQHLVFAQQTLQRAHIHEEQARREEQLQELRKEEMRARQQSVVERKKAEEERKQREERAKKEHEQLLIQQYEEKMRNLRDQWRKEHEYKEKEEGAESKKKGKKRKDKDRGDSEPEEEPSDDEAAKAATGLFGSDEESEQATPRGSGDERSDAENAGKRKGKDKDKKKHRLKKDKKDKDKDTDRDKEGKPSRRVKKIKLKSDRGKPVEDVGLLAALADSESDHDVGTYRMDGVSPQEVTPAGRKRARAFIDDDEDEDDAAGNASKAPKDSSTGPSPSQPSPTRERSTSPAPAATKASVGLYSSDSE